MMIILPAFSRAENDTVVSCHVQSCCLVNEGNVDASKIDSWGSTSVGWFWCLSFLILILS